MVSASNLLKSAAIAGVFAFGMTGATMTPASADTFETHCNSFGDCYRMRCNDWHEDCVRVGYYRSDYDNDRRRWVCDSDGDDCHWQYDSDRYYDRPNVDFGFHF